MVQKLILEIVRTAQKEQKIEILEVIILLNLTKINIVFLIPFLVVSKNYLTKLHKILSCFISPIKLCYGIIEFF